MLQPYYKNNVLPTTCGLPAPEEKEMPIETINMTDDDFDAEQEMKADAAAELRDRWWQVYLAAIQGCNGMGREWVHEYACAIANATIAALPEMEAERDRLIQEVVG